MNPTRIQLCGRMTVEIAGRRLEAHLPGRQGRLLFAYLALNRRRPIERAELSAVLWPEQAPPPAAESTLTGVLSRLRRALGEEVLQGRAQLRLMLPPDAWIDVELAATAIHEAEGAVATGDWPRAAMRGRAALHVARRVFLVGFEAPWIEEQRHTLQTTKASALECVGEAGLNLGGTELATAERCGRALVSSEPYRESGYRLLMRTLNVKGNTAAALTTYDQLRCVLRDELGTAPSSDTQALHRELLAL